MKVIGNESHQCHEVSRSVHIKPWEVGGVAGGSVCSWLIVSFDRFSATLTCAIYSETHPQATKTYKMLWLERPVVLWLVWMRWHEARTCNRRSGLQNCVDLAAKLKQGGCYFNNSYAAGSNITIESSSAVLHFKTVTVTLKCSLEIKYKYREENTRSGTSVIG